MNTKNRKMEQAIKRIKRQFPNSEAVFLKVYESMRQKANDRCICDAPILNWHRRIPGQFKYRCLRCRKVISPLSITPLSRQHKDLTNTIDLACRFYFKRRALTPTEISLLYNCQYRTAVRQSKRTMHWMRLAVIHGGTLSKNINNTKVIRLFASQHNDFTAAVDSLFNALPSLGEAINKSNK